MLVRSASWNFNYCLINMKNEVLKSGGAGYWCCSGVPLGMSSILWFFRKTKFSNPEEQVIDVV